eukprot:9222722-Pyramimonas_sp.AAC.1
MDTGLPRVSSEGCLSGLMVGEYSDPDEVAQAAAHGAVELPEPAMLKPRHSSVHQASSGSAVLGQVFHTAVGWR